MKAATDNQKLQEREALIDYAVKILRGMSIKRLQMAFIVLCNLAD